MSAELLRRAAEKLREHVREASPGPWDATDSYPFLVVGYGEGMVSCNLADHPAGDANYIALVHPPVALALADWLESEAKDVAGTTKAALAVGSPEARVTEMHEIRHAASFAVARAVLREPGDSQ